MAALQLNGVRVVLGGVEVLQRLDLQVEPGECVALLGPSGCGKTTTLRAIAGFVHPQEGEVVISGRVVTGLPADKRNVGLVFQDYALFPHMTLAQNIGYGLKMRKVESAEIQRRVREALELVQLDAMGNRLPAELSGGQRQRIALARALVIRPDVMLLDEPLGALDRTLRDRMQVELRQLQKRLGITTIIVTHDQEEALSLADRVAVMFDGRIEEMGDPASIYEHPRSRKVMQFLGSTNLLDARVIRNDGHIAEVSGAGNLQMRVPDCDLASGWSGQLAVRPEHVELAWEPGPVGCAAATVRHCVYKGSTLEVHAQLSDGTAMVAATTDPAIKAGLAAPSRTDVWLRPRPSFVRFFDGAGDRAG